MESFFPRPPWPDMLRAFVAIPACWETLSKSRLLLIPGWTGVLRTSNCLPVFGGTLLLVTCPAMKMRKFEN